MPPAKPTPDIMPTKQSRYHGTATQQAFRALGKRWLTSEQARDEFGIQTLGQRVSDWTSDGHEFAKRWDRSSIGSRCLAYRLIKTAKAGKQDKKGKK